MLLLTSASLVEKKISESTYHYFINIRYCGFYIHQSFKGIQIEVCLFLNTWQIDVSNKKNTKYPT